jgi:hypothetical protein
LQTGSVPSAWGANARSQRAEVEPGLNRWLGDMLPRPNRILYVVRLNGGPPVEQNIAALRLQPIDLIYLIGDDLNGELTELEWRIVFENRLSRRDDALDVQIEFMTPPANPQAISLFELLPLLRVLRQIVTDSRPLTAGDYALPSETIVNSGIDLAELQTRVETALSAFAGAVEALRASIPPVGANGQPDPDRASLKGLRNALRELALFGVPDAFPLSALGASQEAKQALTGQAVNLLPVVLRRLESAQTLKAAGDDDSLNPQERMARYRAVAQAIFGQAFSLLPRFSLTNSAEVQAAVNFRDASPDANLTRHHRDDPFILEDWLQGVARVQPRVGTLELVSILRDTFGLPVVTQQKPLQLPFRPTDFWVAVEYPETFAPEGEYLSMLQILPSPTFQPAAPQTGLLIDEWVEVIPSPAETTGIAFHFNQPNTEPPQTLLLAVTPETTGKWTWDKLAGILHDTLDRAQLRAVEPEQLGDTALGHLLPAILTPVATHRFATIATDLVYQTAVRADSALDEG